MTARRPSESDITKAAMARMGLSESTELLQCIICGNFKAVRPGDSRQCNDCTTEMEAAYCVECDKRAVTVVEAAHQNPTPLATSEYVSESRCGTHS